MPDIFFRRHPKKRRWRHEKNYQGVHVIHVYAFNAAFHGIRRIGIYHTVRNKNQHPRKQLSEQQLSFLPQIWRAADCCGAGWHTEKCRRKADDIQRFSDKERQCFNRTAKICHSRRRSFRDKTIYQRSCRIWDIGGGTNRKSSCTAFRYRKGRYNTFC